MVLTSNERAGLVIMATMAKSEFEAWIEWVKQGLSSNKGGEWGLEQANKTLEILSDAQADVSGYRIQQCIMLFEMVPYEGIVLTIGEKRISSKEVHDELPAFKKRIFKRLREQKQVRAH